MFIALNMPLLKSNFVANNIFGINDIIDLIEEKPEAFLNWGDRVLLQEPDNSIV